MKKIAFVFSGQGAQYTGMGKELYDNFISVRNLYDKGSEILERNLKDISFNMDIANLSKTINSQPAIFTLSLAAYTLLTENGIAPISAAGFSVGECSAVTAAGCVSIEDGFKIISKRSKAMQKASDECGGLMYAIMGFDDTALKKICDETEGYCIPVNFNCPGQTVIAGDDKTTEIVAQKCIEKGAKKVIKVDVNAAFHSKLMEKAAKEFENSISDINFNIPSFPLYSNISGKVIDDFSNMPDYFRRQITSPVLWIDIIENMITDGVTDFVELGPDKTLCKFIKRINKEVNTYNVENIKTFEDTINALK